MFVGLGVTAVVAYVVASSPAIITAILGMVLPIVAGFALAAALGYDNLTSFFIGLALAATSIGIFFIPIFFALIRGLSERGLFRRRAPGAAAGTARGAPPGITPGGPTPSPQSGD